MAPRRKTQAVFGGDIVPRAAGVLGVVLAVAAVVAAALLWYPPVTPRDAAAFKNTEAFITEPSGSGAVNVNTAPMEELMVLPGIGASKAEAIVQWREENGGFSGPEDLQQVHGIGPKILQEIAELTCY